MVTREGNMLQSDDTRGSVICQDCQNVVEVAFAFALVVGNHLSLTGYAKCLNCYKERGDKRSLTFKVRIPESEVYQATKQGLIVLLATK
jgi:hypothetical protein